MPDTSRPPCPRRLRRSRAETVAALAEDMRDLAGADGAATRPDLIARGWRPQVLDRLGPDAAAQAARGPCAGAAA